MANTSSAKKAIRVAARRNIINLRTKRDYKEARKAVLKAVTKNDKKEAQELLPNAYKAIDKAQKRNVLHKNTAARYKSSLAATVSKLK